MCQAGSTVRLRPSRSERHDGGWTHPNEMTLTMRTNLEATQASTLLRKLAGAVIGDVVIGDVRTMRTVFADAVAAPAATTSAAGDDGRPGARARLHRRLRRDLVFCLEADAASSGSVSHSVLSAGICSGSSSGKVRRFRCRRHDRHRGRDGRDAMVVERAPRCERHRSADLRSRGRCRVDCDADGVLRTDAPRHEGRSSRRAPRPVIHKA